MQMDLDEKPMNVDKEGYLVNYRDWTPALAELLAAEDGISMDTGHWEVIHFLRDYYATYKIAPAVRILVKAIGKKLGEDKANSKYLYQLFPHGPAKQACKIAGLPKPSGCI